MPHRPQVIAFDMIETTISLASLRPRLARRGLPESSLDLWFAHTLRDAFSLAATGVFAPFTEVAQGTLRALCAAHGVKEDADQDKQVLAGFAELDPQPEARKALETAKSAGLRIMALTNGAEESTRSVLVRAGLDGFFERIVSIAEVRRWKPFPDIYQHAAKVSGISPEDLALVAVHPWDLQGAKNAGLTTAFVARGQPFPHLMTKPDVAAETLPEAVASLAALPPR